MPKDKDLKRRVRARMQKTGESYTAARAQLVGRTRLPIPADVAEIAGTGEDALTRATDRSWTHWIRLLDAEQAHQWPHREIAAWLVANHEISTWWAQSVTVGYERVRGLRALGQRRDGQWEVSRSRTFPWSSERVFRALHDDARRRAWLGDVAVLVRAARPPRSLRLTWPDGTSVEMYLTEKGPIKTQLTVQHTRLASAEDRIARREWWVPRLDALGALLAQEDG